MLAFSLIGAGAADAAPELGASAPYAVKREKDAPPYGSRAIIVG